MITLFLTGVTIAFVSVLVVFLIIFYLIRSEEEKYAKKEFNPALSPQPPFGNEALRTRQVRLVPPQSIERRLIEAKNLFEQGLITEEEYRATKSKILGL